jgi:hypothetical protein
MRETMEGDNRIYTVTKKFFVCHGRSRSVAPNLNSTWSCPSLSSSFKLQVSPSSSVFDTMSLLSSIRCPSTLPSFCSLSLFHLPPTWSPDPLLVFDTATSQDITWRPRLYSIQRASHKILLQDLACIVFLPHLGDCPCLQRFQCVSGTSFSWNIKCFTDNTLVNYQATSYIYVTQL